jgi:diguanylate cyclase (GGDEF)-like protein
MMQGRAEGRPDLATILIVDDSNAIRRILRRILGNAGYRVLEAEDGQAALSACGTERPDLVLLDVDMPGMDGLTTLREMRTDTVLQSIPVLFLTARTGADDVAAGLDLGAQDYLRKPCEPAELTARVGRALRAKAREDDLARRAREMTELSTRDALTGISNRRGIEARVAQLIGTAGADAVVTLILVDVDHFKSVNDTFGHAVGDIVLTIVAKRLRGALDEHLLLARWGGEEFLIAGVGLDRVQAQALAERLRNVVCATPFAVAEDRQLAITVSGGCATGALANFDAAILAADSALYEAKRTGRNRIVGAPPAVG